MVPTSLIMIILTLGFYCSAFNYFCRFPHPKVIDPPCVLMIYSGAVMIFTVILAIVAVHIVWLSWVLLIAGIVNLVVSFRFWRQALATNRARDRELAARMAKGL